MNFYFVLSIIDIFEIEDDTGAGTRSAFTFMILVLHFKNSAEQSAQNVLTCVSAVLSQ